MIDGYITLIDKHTFLHGYPGNHIIKKRIRNNYVKMLFGN